MSYFKDCVDIIYKAHGKREIERLTKLLESEPQKDKRQEIMSSIKKQLDKIKKKVDL